MKTFTRNFVFIACAALLLFAQVIIAQEVKPKPIFGFRMAPNIGWMKPDASSYENDGVRVGFSWGFIAEFPLAVNYSFSTGFNILFNGGRLEYPHIINNQEGALQRRYGFKHLELPFILKLYTSDRGGPVFYGQIGLGTGILLDARANDLFIKDNSREDFEKEKITDEIKLFRAALLVGMGVEYPLGPSLKGMVGLSFNNGFSDLLKGSNIKDSSISHSAINNFIELNLGLLF
jgi:hypothetical protein